MAESCVCLAMLVADSVFREEGTSKVHIAGTFNQITAAKFPAYQRSMSLFLAITNLMAGKHSGKVVFNYLEDEEKQLLCAEGPIEAESPLQVVELNFCFRGVVFPKPGTLEIAFFLDDEPIQRRKLILVETPAGDTNA